jgi:hypothetical protein
MRNGERARKRNDNRAQKAQGGIVADAALGDAAQGAADAVVT